VYDVVFSDGSVITADADHRWLTTAWTQGGSGPGISRVLTTADLRAARPGSHAVALAGPLALPVRNLPLDPYLLGCWIGAGRLHRAQITTRDDEIVWAFEDTGYTMHTGRRAGQDTYRVLSGFRERLHDAGVLTNSHIPPAYLRASVDQRQALLEGIMDSAGAVSRSGECRITLPDEGLLAGIHELVVSLGHNPTMAAPGRRLLGGRGRPGWLAFTPATKVCRLSRKLSRQRVGETARSEQWRYVVAVRARPSVPVRCIQVDSPSHLFLAGRSMIPTHNTVLMQHLCVQAKLQGARAIYINPKGFESLSPMLEVAGGTQVRMSALEDRPGALDPFCLGLGPIAADIVGRHILSVMRMTEDEDLALTEGLMRAGRAGVRCAGEALGFVDHPDVANKVLRQCRASPTFSLAIADRPRDAFTMADRLTLIEFDRQLDLPESSKPENTYERHERVALAAMRLVTRMSMELLMLPDDDGIHRGGVMALDEAWTFLSHAESIAFLQRLGREARSQGVFPILATHRIADLDEAK
ncbi:MAG: ATP-binding protein, partial [Acidimicrobiales bacterium]